MTSHLDEPLLRGKDEEEEKLQDDEVFNDVEEQRLLPRCSTGGASFYSNGSASFWRSCLNLSNVISGIGMLSVPYALAQGGWLSLVLFAMVGAICFYSGKLVDRCMRADRSVRSYPDIGHLAFGAVGRTAIGVIMYTELYLVAISFLILEGDNLDKLLPGTTVELLGYQLHGKQLFVLLAAAVILPTTWLKNLGKLAYVSAVGLIASMALTASLVWAGVAENGFRTGGGNLLNLSGLPSALSLYFVCFAGHGVFPTVYTSMKRSRDFPKVLLISSVLCSLNYTLTAVLGYMIYGDDVHAQVTLNLPTGKLYTRIAILMTLITPLAKYALVIQPITTVIEEKLKRSATTMPMPGNNGLGRVFTSTIIVITMVALACTLPFFGYLMSLIGSSLNVTVAVLFPCLCYLKIYMHRGIHRLEVAAIIGILLFGVCAAVIGTYTSLHQIIGTF
ncbi:amino acid transporter AVT1I-like [Oryza brachyantha]|uniref:amino acid transporter AVT1I-like n=1 Tax=Oryza brachyantha TaxID=4533 RepID=UPI001ADD0508|nr:amino acid transporter AVT1I-like [Oryza brachyantha]XP_040375863.1 amino acid transporter AVT1I-like [Oryza brachyantha]